MELISIAPMTSDDLADVMAIEEACFTVPWTEGDFRDLLNHPGTGFYTAKTAEGTLCGYVGYIGVMEAGDILNVAVHPDYRQLGIGRRLMLTAEKAAAEQGVEAMLLEVRESNRAARQLYNSLGYEEISLRRNYYRKPVEHAIIMRKLLGVQNDERRHGDGKDIT